MDKTGVPQSSRPLNTYYEPSKDFYFNGEAIFSTTRAARPTPAAMPHRPLPPFGRDRGRRCLRDHDVSGAVGTKNGGTVEGLIDGMVEPQSSTSPVPKRLQEGGTCVIPGHGRVSDEADVLEYRDMPVIVRESDSGPDQEGQDARANQGRSSDLDFDSRYGARRAARVDDRDVHRRRLSGSE